MVSRGDRIVVVWPIYFDSNVSRDKGRRVNKGLAVSNPTLEEIAASVRSLGLDHVVEDGACHPSRWWRCEGRILVRKTAKKTKIIRMIATRLKYRRQKEAKKDRDGK